MSYLVLGATTNLAYDFDYLPRNCTFPTVGAYEFTSTGPFWLYNVSVSTFKFIKANTLPPCDFNVCVICYDDISRAPLDVNSSTLAPSLTTPAPTFQITPSPTTNGLTLSPPTNQPTYSPIDSTCKSGLCINVKGSQVVNGIILTILLFLFILSQYFILLLYYFISFIFYFYLLLQGSLTVNVLNVSPLSTLVVKGIYYNFYFNFNLFLFLFAF